MQSIFSLDIGIGVGVLIQVAHHGKESGLISVKAAPRMKAHIRFSVLFPSRDSKENGRYSRCYFKVGEQLKFFRVGWLKILREILSISIFIAAPFTITVFYDFDCNAEQFISYILLVVPVSRIPLLTAYIITCI